MALKKIIKTGVETGQTIEALQVSQSYDAFNPSSTVGYEIGISGSLEVSGSSTFHLATAADKFTIKNVAAKGPKKAFTTSLSSFLNTYEKYRHKNRRL